LVLSLLLLALSANFGYLYNKQLVTIRAYNQLLLQRENELEAQRMEKARLERIEQERLAKELKAKRLSEAEKQRRAEEGAKTRAKLDSLRQAELEAIRQRGLLTISGESEGTREVKLTVNQFSELTIKVNKGMRLGIPNNYYDELFKIAYFQNNSLVYEKLVTHAGGIPPPWYLFYFFWDNYDLKLKSAEVPHTLIFRYNLRKEKLALNYDIIGDAYFMEKGETVTTKIYLDERDRFEIEGITFNSIDLDSYAGRDFIADYNRKESLDAFRNDMGYLQINAKRRIIVNKIKLERITYDLSLNLQQNKVYQMKVYKGDIIKTESGVRYYVNNQIMDKNKGNIHNIDNDGYLELKGSYGAEQINLRVLKRKGY